MTYQLSPLLVDTLESIESLGLPVVHLEHLADGASCERDRLYLVLLQALEFLLEVWLVRN